jgi:ribosomal protein L25 (general stress protein Ctc)
MVLSSRKPISKKMYIKEGYSVLLVNEPDGYREKLQDRPDGVTISKPPVKKDVSFDFIHVFVQSKKELEAHLPKLKSIMAEQGLMWVSYPKGSSGMKVDINRDTIWAYSRTIGMTAVSQISIDDKWSAMRLKTV